MSCANPPLQGMPSEGELRKAVVAPEGYKLVVSDLSQIEIRILAALSEDETLIRAFEGGADIHRSVAATVLGKKEEYVTDEERKIAKSIVFGQMYGQGVEGLRNAIQNRLGREFSAAEAREYWNKFFDAYPGVKRWRDKESMMFDAGYRETRTLKGRRRLDVDTKTKRWNTPIQGLAADTLKAIAVSVYERREEIPDLEMVGLVHDEVILLVPEEHADRAAGWLTEIMEGIGDAVVNGDRPEKRVPIKADTCVCARWGDKN
jgi:DNA polymerase I